MSEFSIATLLQNSIYGYPEPMKNTTSLNQEPPTIGKKKLYQMFIERAALGHIRVGNPWARGKGKYFGRPFSHLLMNIGIEPGFMHIEAISDKEPYHEVYRIPYSEEVV